MREIVQRRPVMAGLLEPGLGGRVDDAQAAFFRAALNQVQTSPVQATPVAPAAVVADRLSFNTKSGKAVQGEGELLDTLASGKLKLEEFQGDSP